MGWDDWREGTGEACEVCAGAGVLDTGDKGHGACPACGGSGEVEGPEDEGLEEGEEGGS